MKAFLFKKEKFVTACLLFFLTIFFIDSKQGDNSLTRAFTVICLAEQGTFSIDSFYQKTGDIAFVNGHYYADKAPLPTLCTLPFYVAFSTLFPTNNQDLKIVEAIYIGTIVCGIIPYFLLVLLLMRAYQTRHPDRSYSSLLLLVIFSSFIYTYASAFWGHMLASLLLYLCYRCWQQKMWLMAGMLGGAVFACDYLYAVVLACWGLYQLLQTKQFKSFFLFGMGCLPGILLVMLHNYVVSGHPFETAYKSFATAGFEAIKTNYGFSYPFKEALWGMSFSDYRGVIWYVPYLLPFFLFDFKKTEIRMVLLSFLIFFVVLTSFHFWHGGWCYGPRYLLPMAVVLLAVFCDELPALKSIPQWVYVYFSSFFVLHFIGRITTGNSIPTAIAHPLYSGVLNRLKEGEFNANNILSIGFGMPPIFADFVWLLMFVVTLVWLHQLKSSVRAGS